MKLPRSGHTQGAHNYAGSADWASEDDIIARAYQPGDIWLGIHHFPTDEAAEVIDRLDGLETFLQSHERVDPEWRDLQIAKIDEFREHLECTDSVEIGISDDRHMATQGGTRGGKGTTAIIPNLCLYPGSAICIDPKGENARICAARRGKGSEFCEGLGQEVVILDPYRTTGLPIEELSAFNPLDFLDPKDEAFIDRAAGIADALFIRTKTEDAHFDETARIFVKALILFVAEEYVGRNDRNLLTVYSLLLNGAKDQLTADMTAAGAEEPTFSAFEYLLELMLDQPERADGVIAGAANTLLQMGDRERGSVLSTARRNLEFLERRGIARTLAQSTFELDRIKTALNGMSIFLCLPPQRMHDTARFLRLMINACLERMYEVEAEPATGYPVLFLLEEFATLGHMEILENAVGYAAGFGVKFWTINQDITQLKRHYRDSWETFLGNAGVVQAFANSDTTTLEYLSKKAGQIEISQITQNLNTTRTASSNNPSDMQRAQSAFSTRGAVAALFSSKTKGQSASTSATEQEQLKLTPLIQPDEIERVFSREAMAQLLLVKGERPIAIARQNYFDTPRFLGLYEAPRGSRHTKAQATELAQAKRGEFEDWRNHLIQDADAWITDLITAIHDADKKLGKKR